ncbi:MAG TPA: DUF624 domain-containing protein [Candidatus Mediterraneibacter excrementigallinarum]|nr:DUF624 domain-containing protein [Candidatus Mediterraneibacter excrementigallinarum]
MSIFSTEGKLAGALNRSGDLIALNLLTLLFMAPVVTAGAAVTSMYEITLKMVKNEEGGVAASFLRAFRNNFKKSTEVWLGGLALTAFLGLDIWLLGRLDASWVRYYKILLFVLALLVMMFTVFSLVTAARFENTLKNTIKNGILFCVIHFLKSILMFAVMLIPAGLLFLSPRFWCVIVLIGVSGPAFLTSFYFRELFRNFEK